MTQKKIAVLISGNGSNLQQFIDLTISGELPASICCVISNKPEAYGLTRAKNAGIDALCIDHTKYQSREDFDLQLIKQLHEYEPDLIILAGFMRILSSAFVHAFSDKILNIHPSLLPKYPGLNTHQRAIDEGDAFAGATVHFVTAELDGGPAIIQAKVPVDSSDTADTLAQKVAKQEHNIYPKAAKWFLEERLYIENNQAYFDQKVLPPTGV